VLGERLPPRANIGTASNIIAQDCLVDWHFRAMPTDDPQWITDRALGFLDELRMRMQAHQPDEFITLEQIEAGTAFMRKLIERLRR
jgi:hypothetical protein